MRNLIIERVWDVFLKRNLAYILTIFFRVLQNLMPTAALKHKCHLLKNHNSYIYKHYTFYNLSEYLTCNKLPVNSYDIESSKIYVINNFYINYFDDCAYIHDGKRNILNESFPYNNRLAKIFKENIIKQDKIKTKYLDKAVNCAMNSGKNYWHFTYTMLPLIYDMEKHGYDGKYLVWEVSFVKQLVNLLGISFDRLEFVKQGDVYQVKELHVIDDYCWGSAKNPELLLEMRDKILSSLDLSDLDKYPKRLYIRRIKPYSRTVKNEAEVIELLNKYNFSAIFPDAYSVMEQIKYFRAADIIICPHGGCSTNAMFMKQNSQFVECFGFNYINSCMLAIIKPNFLSYNMLVEGGDACNISSVDSDYNINLALLEDTIYKYVNEPVKI